MKRNKAVFLYNLTDHMATPWLNAGYTCYIVDMQHPDGVSIDPAKPGLIKVGMKIDDDFDTLKKLVAIVGSGGVAFVAGFPPCDDMAVSGARWFADKLKLNPDCQKIAAGRAKFVETMGKRWQCPWMAENPVSILSTLWRKADFTFDPCDYAMYLAADDVHPEHPDIIPRRDRYRKKTLIWCGNGFVQPQKLPYPPLKEQNPGWQKLGGKSLRTKNIRSATPRGFALAVFEANHHDN